MFEEEIILLVKGKDYENAIQIFVDNKMFKEAEQFCNERPKLELMTTLLEIYFKQYKKYNAEKNFQK